MSKQFMKYFSVLLQKLYICLYHELPSISHRASRSILYHTYWYKFANKNFKGLHLGSGDRQIKGFCNIDANIFRKSNVIAGIERIKLRSETVEIIYTSHVFEHIPRNKAKNVLKEWYRVLKKGGVLYICVPNVETLFEIYLNNISEYQSPKSRFNVDLACGVLYGGQVNKYDYHFYGYSFTTLKWMLKDVGFTDIQQFNRAGLDFCEFRDAGFATIDGVPISLNVKAIK